MCVAQISFFVVCISTCSPVPNCHQKLNITSAFTSWAFGFVVETSLAKCPRKCQISSPASLRTTLNSPRQFTLGRWGESTPFTQASQANRKKEKPSALSCALWSASTLLHKRFQSYYLPMVRTVQMHRPWIPWILASTLSAIFHLHPQLLNLWWQFHALRGGRI